MTFCRKCGFPKERDKNCPCRVAGEYNPTAEQIAEACRKIQAGWSEQTERERRCRQNPEPDYGRVVRVESE